MIHYMVDTLLSSITFSIIGSQVVMSVLNGFKHCSGMQRSPHAAAWQLF